MTTPKFLQGKGDFHIELKKRVNQYFTDKKRPMTGNNALLFKALLFCLGYILLYIHLVFFTRRWTKPRTTRGVEICV